ncbi:hypothetical protein GQ457_11G023280 [Hibiscus cannabinus]
MEFEKAKGKKTVEQYHQALKAEKDNTAAWKRKAHDIKIRLTESQRAYDALEIQLNQSRAQYSQLEARVREQEEMIREYQARNEYAELQASQNKIEKLEKEVKNLWALVHTSHRFQEHDKINEKIMNLSQDVAEHVTALAREARILHPHVVSNEMKASLELLFDQIKDIGIRNAGTLGGIDARELSLVNDLVIPPKFKVPEFEKFTGTTCPSAHLTMNCQKMSLYLDNEKLLIHYFQDSLVGSAARWYTQLSRAHIKTWRDLSKAFLEKYKHISDMVPSRTILQTMEQKTNESFHQYAQRWRDVAAQVEPPLLENEITLLFVNTLKDDFYDRMLDHATKPFADMVMTGELIQAAIKNGRIRGGNDSRKYTRKRDNEVNTASSYAPGHSTG